MGKVWIYTEGSYSDYHVEAVFSTKEKADAYAAQCGEYGGVDEWDVDEFADHVRRPWWVCEIDLETGDLVRAREGSEVISPHERGSEESGTGTSYDPTSYNLRDVASGKSFVSKDHAMKLAVEARQAYLRKQAEAWSGTN